MRSIISKASYSATLFLVVLIFVIVTVDHLVECRTLHTNNNPSDESLLVSDGVHDPVHHPQHANTTNYLHLKHQQLEVSVVDVLPPSEKYCEQMYGFLPCSNKIVGHLFLILVYEYLLFHGESYLAAGGEQIFKILGPGIFGASAFDILGALPESLILLGYGITMDVETRKMAIIMALSVIPLFIMQIPNLFHSSSSSPRFVTLIVALTIALIFLISYFIYQVFEPHIEIARLDYIKHNEVILSIFELVEEQTLRKILKEDGTPNVDAINKIYHEIRPNTGQDSPAAEENNKLKNNLTEEQKTNLLKIFDKNNDNYITAEEFETGMTDYINQTKHALKYLSRESLKKFYQTLIKPWIGHVKKEKELKGLISEVLKHVPIDVIGGLRNNEGKADKTAIRRLFEKADSDRDNRVSRSELKEMIKNDHHFSLHVVDVEETVTKLLEHLDVDRDNEISEGEFVDGFEKLINSISSTHENQTWWGYAEEVTKQKQSKGILAWLKAIAYVVLGITMLSLLAEPLIESVRNLSREAGISSFFVSLILVPLATNFREATSAIREASYKKSSNTSQTIYEIYGAVFMNNILGFVVISTLIYVRDITWEFSADVLVVAIVCALMGIAASFRHTFPLWTSIPAYLLYLLSLLFVFVLKDVFNYV
ncbi:hypothetical protein PIB30_025452 [Stylosanthes scabra]|uniref:EF-hand domain-containing protein n=1 Tax=Stylosanthes scabra TaxID=79078 RepID=A0ABU6U9B5_9FABA|nr:hypothetical protein [Stylosanthes scabra]